MISNNNTENFTLIGSVEFNKIKKKKREKDIKPEKKYAENYDYLHYISGKSNKQIKKEFDSIKYYAKKLDFDYDKLINVYTNDFYAACKHRDIDEHSTMNLFLALLEFLRTNHVTDKIAIDTLEETSRFIANSKDFDTEEYFTSSKYRTPNLVKIINFATKSCDKPSDANYVSQEIADNLHFLFKDNVDGAKNEYVHEQKEEVNKPNEGENKKTLLDIIMAKSKFSPYRVIYKFLNKQRRNKQQEIDEQKNKFEYYVDEEQKENLFEKFKDPTLLNYEFPTDLFTYADDEYTNNDWLNQFALSNISEISNFKGFEATIAETAPLSDIVLLPDTTPQIEQAPQVKPVEVIAKPVNHSAVLTRSVIRDELTAVFDEFALNRGYI